MAKSIWNQPDRAALLARADSLRPDQRPLWGKISATRMIRHRTVPPSSASGSCSRSVSTRPAVQKALSLLRSSSSPRTAIWPASGWGALTHRHIDHHWKQFGV